ncbi:MAG: hypothetical protein K6E50_07930 [Lachnospiraceae bacterium]|nr:hypothetical protein [Lachnospiraceae bacterium]
MGKANNAINHYLSDKRRFADLFNAVLYGGKQVLDPERLTEISGTTYEDLEQRDAGKAPKRRERRNDITMRYEDGQIYRILISEAQNSVSYVLPLRNLDYLAAGYHKQYEKIKKHHDEADDYADFAERSSGMRKGERLIPLHILWVYHGERAWDGPRNFQEMLHANGSEDLDLSVFFEPRLLCINEIKDYANFQTELRLLLELLGKRNDKEELFRLVDKDERFEHLGEDTFETASVLLDTPTIWKRRKRYLSGEEREGYSMCKAIREMVEEAEKRGEKREALRILYDLVKDGVLSMKDAAARAGITEAAFQAGMEKGQG